MNKREKELVKEVKNSGLSYKTVNVNYIIVEKEGKTGGKTPADVHEPASGPWSKKEDQKIKSTIM